MVKTSKINNKTYRVLIVYLLFESQFFGLGLYEPISYYVRALFSILILLVFFRFHKPKNGYKEDVFKYIIPLLFIIPYLCGITKLFIKGGIPLYTTIIMTSTSWLIYYIFIAKEVMEETIVKSIVCVGVLLFCIQVYQVLFPNYAIFGVYSDVKSAETGEISEIRNGIHRFKLGGYCLTLFSLYYYWQRLLEKVSRHDMIMFLIFLISMYLHLTRQVMFSAIVTLGLSFLLVGNSKSKSRRILIIIALLAIASLVGASLINSLFSDLSEQTESDLSSDDYVRYLSFEYFGTRIFTSPLTMICGNGGIEDIDALGEDYGLYPSDVGFVGEAYFYGLLWIVLWLYTMWLVLGRYRDSIPLYIKLYVFGSFLYSWGMFPYRFPQENLIWLSGLYISSLYINKKKLLDFHR